VKVFVAGATGVLGAAAVPGLIAAGYEVVGLARTSSKAQALHRAGATPVTADLFDPDALQAAMTRHGCDAVLNLATHIPTGTAALTRHGWAHNDRIRTEGSAALVAAALGAGVRRFVQEGVTFGYADGGDTWLDEDAPLDAVGHVATVLDAAGNARDFAARSGGAAVVLWFAQFYGDDPLTRTRLALARRGLPAVFGAPQGWAASVHIGDAGTAVVAALAAPPGTYNVADTPLRHREQAAALAAAVGRARGRTAGPVALALGGAPARILGRSQRISSQRFRDATRWSPRYPDFAAGLAALRRNGYPRAS